jgi:hypothetical protein
MANDITTNNDYLTGTPAADSIYARTGNDTLIGGAGNDYLDADTYAEGHDAYGYDWLFGQSGADSLYGGGSEDFLDGGQGPDILYGGGGADRCYGGGGRDTFIYDALDTVDGGRGIDRITLYYQFGLDLTAVPNRMIRDIEIIDMGTHTPSNTLTLNRADLLAITSTTNILKVLGHSGDEVNIVGPFEDLGISGRFHEYKLGTGMLLVDTDIKDVG